MVVGIIAVFFINCSGGNGKVQEKNKATDTKSTITANKKQDNASVDTSQAIFNIPIEGYKATELGQAVYTGNIVKVQTLINKGASIEKCLTDETYIYDILYTALVFNKVELVNYILRNKLYSSVNKTYTEESETPLTLACGLHDTSNALEIADTLIALGADANGTGESGGENTKYPLLIAVNQRNAGLTKLLIKHGAKKDIKNQAGETPLAIAQKKGFEDITGILKGD